MSLLKNDNRVAPDASAKCKFRKFLAPLGSQARSVNVAQELGVKRTFQKQKTTFFMEGSQQQLSQLQAAGKERAYDPLGPLEIEDRELYIDPIPAMQALSFGYEDIFANAGIDARNGEFVSPNRQETTSP